MIVEIGGKEYAVPELSIAVLARAANAGPKIRDKQSAASLNDLVAAVHEALSPTYAELTIDFLMNNLEMPTAIKICEQVNEQLNRALAEGKLVRMKWGDIRAAGNA